MSRLARLSQRSTALFVCDIQSVFKPLIHEMPSVIAGASVLMRAAAALQVPMLVTEQYPKAFGHTVDELADLARTHSVPVLEKSRFSMLSPATLDAVKPEQGLQSVVLCGIEAHVCVQQTALDLLEKGISVHLPVDAVSSQRPTDREAALFQLAQAGATITSIESVIFSLLEDAKHPSFKSLLGVIKENANTPSKLGALGGPHAAT